MCLEDIRLGRALAPDGPRNVTALAGGARLVGPDPNRTRLIVSIDGTSNVNLTAAESSPGAFVSWRLSTQLPSVVLRVEDWGKLITGTWWATDPVGAAVVTVTAMTLEKQ